MTSATQGSDLKALEAELLREISQAGDLSALEHVRVSALGKKGRVSALMASLGSMAPEERKGFGAAVNEIKDRVNAALDGRKGALEAHALVWLKLGPWRSSAIATCPAARFAMTAGMKYGLIRPGPLSRRVMECR